MPYNDPDATDPMTLTGVVIATEDDRAMREMADCFVEEYMRLGFDSERLVHLFKTRGYIGPFMAYSALGEPAIRALIEEHARRRRPVRSTPCGHESARRVKIPLNVVGEAR